MALWSFPALRRLLRAERAGLVCILGGLRDGDPGLHELYPNNLSGRVARKKKFSESARFYAGLSILAAVVTIGLKFGAYLLTGSVGPNNAELPVVCVSQSCHALAGPTRY